ncbi:Endonuclease/exonuclease/phosphatase [Aspergillus cavernicola]|uniref:DNA-(apurinic or apyrimidinic site) endonuclease 2 n=1 Tax=Aspergillus cavernicola TaxID=176166 RepID=A0ABR4IU26_9EURO
MGFRITTWNVNGIRNPFSYEPWRSTRTFESMFDILEADIVVFQETKIQRKDLKDDMVLVSGWDCYFSLPRVKKGYSGVVIYTRNATCAPIRAEEGLTGTLCPPNSSVSFKDLPEDQQIGGYPTAEQLSQLELDADTLDSEGRCVILEFPAFVLLGLYCPANRDESRDSFRHSFLDLMEARIRNLVAMGKRVFVTGDLNISRGEIDAAHATENIRKGVLTEDDFVSAPARRLFNHLLSDGKVPGDRDERREQPALFDICRSFHPSRRGMYTCWEQRINARPGNYGSRIDYVLCSLDMQNWFCDSNIQEGLMGSDHCPVYAVFEDSVPLHGSRTNIYDIMNPPGVFQNGKRQQKYASKLMLPLSARLIPEFDKRRSIKDMFMRKSSETSQKTPPQQSTEVEVITKSTDKSLAKSNDIVPTLTQGMSRPKELVRKRPARAENPTVKRAKSMTSQTATSPARQSSLKGFFKPQNMLAVEATDVKPLEYSESELEQEADDQAAETVRDLEESNTPIPMGVAPPKMEIGFVDPIASKEDWSRLFTKKPPPKCESHQEQCIGLKTKKPGVNFGRSFWICPRPLGPSGNKEKGTGWRCPTFIWASDWDSSTM